MQPNVQTSYETGLAALQALSAWYSENESDRNEATTRHHLIDVLIHDCLRWPREDVIAEESLDGQYTDYSFTSPRRILIVEAKREGKYFEVPAGSTLEVPLLSLTRGASEVSSAVRQVAQYCQTRGVPLAAACNGHQLVCFLASREDSRPPLEGKAIVFRSLQHMINNFLDLWQLLSKPAIAEGLYRPRLSGDITPVLPPRLSETIDHYPGTKHRSDFQSELNLLSDIVIEDITRRRELEHEFLEECYCESGALSQYSLLSKDILAARYAAVSRSPDLTVDAVPIQREGLTPEILAESLSGRPIILIGDRGVGKSMFIRNFIKVEAADIIRDAISLYVDFGSAAALSVNVRLFVIDDIIRQLREDYGVDIFERNFVRSVYHSDLERFKRGIFSDLLKLDADRYRHSEIDLLKEKTAARDQFLKDSLVELSRNQKRQIVLFLDNADQRDPEFQQLTFLIAQEFSANGVAATFVSLRPETFYESVRFGTLSGYNPRVFTIAPPRLDRVIEKRLKFALRIATGGIRTEVVQGGLTFSSAGLSTMLRVMLSSLSTSEPLSRCLDNIASGDVRKALSLIQTFIGSGHIRSDRIVESFERDGSYTIAVRDFLRGIILGDYEYYFPQASPVANLFDVTLNDRREHFLLPLALGFLSNFRVNEHVEGFVKSPTLYGHLQGLGFVPQQIDSAVGRGIERKLIESGSRFIAESSSVNPRVLRVTQDGVYHYDKLAKELAYIDSVLVDVPIFDDDVRGNIHEVHEMRGRLQRAEAFISYLDSCWQLVPPSASIFDWSAASARVRQQIARLAKGRGSDPGSSDDRDRS